MAPPHPLLSHPSHRIPTLYSLYRPLLRLAPNPTFKEYIRREFRRNRGLGGLDRVRRKWEEGENLLRDFERLPSSPSLQSTYAYLTSHLTSLIPPSPPAALPPKKPLLAPSLLYSQPYHPPLHRLRPQPENISMMIFNRRRAVQRRWDKLGMVKEWEAMEKEVFGESEGWRDVRRGLERSMRKDEKTNEMRFSKEMVLKARESNVRREKFRQEKALSRKKDKVK